MIPRALFQGGFRKWATGLKTGLRAGASTRLPTPLKEPKGATLPLDQQIQIHYPLSLVALKFQAQNCG